MYHAVGENWGILNPFFSCQVLEDGHLSMNMPCFCFIMERGSNDVAWESAISLSHVTSSESKLRSASYKLPPLLLVGFKDVQFMFSLKKHIIIYILRPKE